MKILKHLRVIPVLVALAFAAAALPSFAQAPTYVINFANVPPGNGVSGFWEWWGECGYLFDPNQSATPGTNDGSFYITDDPNFPGVNGGTVSLFGPANGNTDNQWCIAGDFASTNGAGSYSGAISLDLTQYTNVQVTFKYDSTNSDFPLHDLNTNGDNGLVLGVSSGSSSPGWGQIWLGTDQFPDAASNGWVTLNYPINPATAGISSINGIMFKKYSGGGLYNDPEITSNASKIAFWIGSVVFQPSTALPTPPTVGLAPATAGLNLFNGATAIYTRENLQSVDDNLSWVGATSPVSYSFTVDNYGGGAFQTQIFLVPGAPTENDPDWQEPNVVFLDMENAGAGSLQWTFRYKTNQANGNSMLYGAGGLASIFSTSVNGTYTLTFTHNTNVTMTVPGGVTTNFTIPDDAAGDTINLFANPLDVYFGVQAGNSDALGQKSIFSNFSVSGLPSDSFSDDFTSQTALANDANWTVNANDPTSLQIVPAGNPFWVTLTSPANGYNILYKPSLNAGSAWNTNTGITTTQIGTTIYGLVPNTIATNLSQGYLEALDVVTNQ